MLFEEMLNIDFMEIVELNFITRLVISGRFGCS